MNSVVSDLWTSKEDHDRRKESLELISWVTPRGNPANIQLAKALVLRTHARGYEVVQLLLDLLSDEKWGIDAARAFQTITSDDDLLNKANHAVIRLLHKQRFFMYVFPKLVESASSQNDSGMTVQVCY